MKQKELSHWLMGTVILLTVCCIILCILVVPSQGRKVVQMYPEFENIYLPCLIFVEVTFFPVFISLFLAWKIFADIGHDNSFSRSNALRLRTISRLALLDTSLYFIGALILLAINRLHPGVLIIILAILFMGVCFTVACAALSHLTRKAADLKDDSDLTI